MFYIRIKKIYTMYIIKKYLQVFQKDLIYAIYSNARV